MQRLEEHCNANTGVYRIVNKPVVGTQPREFIDKKLHFRTSDCDPSVPPELDEIYIWVSSTPNDIFEMDPSKFTRADSVLGI